MPSLIAKTNMERMKNVTVRRRLPKLTRSPPNWAVRQLFQNEGNWICRRRLLKPSSLDQAINSKLPKRAG